MSRVAKAPIHLPANVELTIAEGEITVKGPKGVLKKPFNKSVAITKDSETGKIISFAPASNDAKAWEQAGTVRANMNNMIKGVTEGFVRSLDLVGVGYRAQAAGKVLNLTLGYSHPIVFNLPEGISAETPAVTNILLKGIDKQLLGQVAANIRSLRKPEPYKGKGVCYTGERIARKVAKKK